VEQLVFVERRRLPPLLGAVQHQQRIGRRVAVALVEDAQVEARPLVGLEPMRDAVGLVAGQHALLLVGGKHIRRVRVSGLNQILHLIVVAAKVDGRPGPQRVRDPLLVGALEHELAGGLSRHGDLGWRR